MCRKIELPYSCNLPGPLLLARGLIQVRRRLTRSRKNKPKSQRLPAGPVQGPDFQILPDALLVYGQGASGFSVEAAISENSRLASYSEDVDEISLTGVEIVEKVSREYSVDPRLLLALLDYRSGWVQAADTENVHGISNHE